MDNNTLVKLPRRGLSTKWLGLLLGVLLGVGIVSFSMLSQRSPLRDGEPVPDFTVITLDGQTMALDDLRGQIVVVNFWASWCAPCRTEVPDLQRIHELYSDQGVVVLGITHTESNERDTRAFIEQFDLSYPNALGADTTITQDYHIVGVPETFVIDAEGHLAVGGHFSGAVTMAQLSTLLDSLLAVE